MAILNDRRTFSLGSHTHRTTILPPTEGVDDEIPIDASAPRFDSLETVGIGGLGEVLAARDRDIGRRVAIKRIREDRHSTTAVERFVREVRTVGGLEHPNIVTIHDVGRAEDGRYYFVMNYIDGDSMEAVIDQLRGGDRATVLAWPMSRRINLFRQLLHAVQFAHDRGVIHRDLKPANIMIGHHGIVQIVDWGIAKQLDDGKPSTIDTLVPDAPAPAETLVGALIGTPRYMAPEQARGAPSDRRTDTYALSLVLYEWLSLQHPRDGIDDLDDLLRAAQHLDAPRVDALPPVGSNPRVPPDLGWFVHDGLKRDPADRYQTVSDMIDRLGRRDEGDVPGQCIATMQKSYAMRLVQFVDRHPFMSLLSIFAVAVGSAASLGGAGLLGVILGAGWLGG